MEPISVILSDLDGTLFHDDKTISDCTKHVIRKAQERGILFGIATSRALVNAKLFLEGVSPDIMITNGGGLAYCGGKKIYSCEFSSDEVRLLLHEVFRLFGTDAVISADNEEGFFCSTNEIPDVKSVRLTDFSTFSLPCMKLCVQTHDKEKIAEVASVLGEDQVDFLPFSDIPWYKMSKKDATKEKAVEALCRHLGILPERIAAFGDDFSDKEMLRLCGSGIAMGNAIDEVKRACGHVTGTNNDDGVARWISEHVLQPDSCGSPAALPFG